jgi:hypothetical protein
MTAFSPVEQRRGAPKNDKVRAAKRMISRAVRNANFALQHAQSSGGRTPEEGKRIDRRAHNFPVQVSALFSRSSGDSRPGRTYTRAPA